MATAEKVRRPKDTWKGYLEKEMWAVAGGRWRW